MAGFGAVDGLVGGDVKVWGGKQTQKYIFIDGLKLGWEIRDRVLV